MARLEGKVALVTGAASGIGRASAARLASGGAAVLCADIDENGLEQTVSAISEAGGRAQAKSCDVSDPAACTAAVAAATESFGRLDTLCNIAGIGIYKHVADYTVAEWERTLAVNLSGAFFMSQAALPQLLETKGSIVNMASSAGLVGLAYSAAYCASKGGLVLLTKSMAVELRNRGVRVNCICPGGVRTPLTLNIEFPEDARKTLMDRMSLDEPPAFCEPEEIAALVAYMASDEARHMSGSAVSIDAGQTA